MIHEFGESLLFGEKEEDELFWAQVYVRAFPGIYCWKKNKGAGPLQRDGIDRWLYLADKTITVEEKKRKRRYRDILLEHTSNSETGAPGWINKPLTCDYFSYAFMPTRECFIFPWPALRAAWQRNEKKWRGYADGGWAGLKNITATNPGYCTLSIVVPIDMLCREVVGVKKIEVPA